MTCMNIQVNMIATVRHHLHPRPNIQVLIMQPMKVLHMNETIAENIIRIPLPMQPPLMQVSFSIFQ